MAKQKRTYVVSHGLLVTGEETFEVGDEVKLVPEEGDRLIERGILVTPKRWALEQEAAQEEEEEEEVPPPEEAEE